MVDLWLDVFKYGLWMTVRAKKKLFRLCVLCVLLVLFVPIVKSGHSCFQALLWGWLT
jgi:hypothetical protein